MPPYKLVPVEYIDPVTLLGRDFGEIIGASISKVSWELSAPGSMDFTVPSDHPGWRELILPNREVQFWDGKTLRWWGIPWQDRRSSQGVQFSCEGLPSYFAKRVVGRRVNFVTNGDFSNGTTGWTAVNAPDFAATDPYLSSPAALRVGRAPTGDTDSYAEHAIAGGASNVSYVAVGHLYVTQQYSNQGTPPFPGGSFDNRALALYDAANAGRFAAVELHEGIQIGVWHRFVVILPFDDAGLAVNPVDLRVRLYNCGDVRWDEIAVYEYRTNAVEAFNTLNAISNLVAHGQSQPDSDMAIDAAFGGQVGIPGYYAFSSDEHAVILDAIDQLADIYPGLDWDMSWSAATGVVQRNLNLYDRKGTNKATFGVDPFIHFRHPVHMVDYSVVTDRKAIVNEAIGTGEGSGADLLEAIWTDAAARSEWHLRQTVENMSEVRELGALRNRARMTVERSKDPVAAIEWTVPLASWAESTNLLDDVLLGDTVYVTIDEAAIDGAYRIVAITLNCDAQTVSYVGNVQ